jgi:phosphoribosylamine--glycine ligase
LLIRGIIRESVGPPDRLANKTNRRHDACRASKRDHIKLTFSNQSFSQARQALISLIIGVTVKVLIVGGGGREHALAWKVSTCAGVTRVYAAPGNAGTAVSQSIENVDISASDLDGLLAFARANEISLTIVGPEQPLVAGIVDQFQAAGLSIFGPTAAAARLEGSKAYCKHFLKRHRIPTAAYEVFTDLGAARDHINSRPTPMVVKADGLAAGKGVIIAQTREEAIQAAEDMLQQERFGSAGATVVIEDFLVGEELSYICMVDGKNILPLATSQDHKARDEGDTGPNTGGMGAYSPANGDTPALQAQVIEQVIQPTVDGMIADGNPFTGFLYAGLMVAPDGSARVLEFNVRCGDPETQPLLLRLDSDLVQLCCAAVDGRLADFSAQWSEQTSIGVVMAAGGYPAAYRSGDVINGLDDLPDDVQVFHAGTKTDNGATVTSGGRVLCVTALGSSVADARQRVYAAVERIQWEDAYYRRDIGHRAL